MSLLAMSTDVQDRDLAGRKRSHGDFLNQESCGAAAFRDSEHIQADHSLSDSKWDLLTFEAAHLISYLAPQKKTMPGVLRLGLPPRLRHDPARS
jgi:hypothetical protein